MLAYFLAIALALASLYLYLSAFFARDIHRQDDFLWSGVGLFYALILWICAGQVKGSILLGQGAAVALVLSFGWQTLQLRRAIANPDQPVDTEGFSVMAWLKERFSGKKSTPVPPEAESPSEISTETPASPPVTSETEEEESTPLVTSTPNEIETEAIDEIETEETPIVEEEAIAVTDTPTTEETTDQNPLNEILEDLEDKSEEIATPTPSEITLEEDDLDFEPYISDNEEETVIEAYTPPTINPVVTEKDENEEKLEKNTATEEDELIAELDEFMEEIEKEDEKKS